MKKVKMPLVLLDNASNTIRFINWDSEVIHFIIKSRGSRLETKTEVDKKLSQTAYFHKAFQITDLTDKAKTVIPERVFIKKVSPEEVLTFSKSEDLTDKDDQKYKKTLIWSSYAHVALVFIGFAIWGIQKLFFAEVKPFVEIPITLIPKVVTAKTKVVVKATTQKIEPTVKQANSKRSNPNKAKIPTNVATKGKYSSKSHSKSIAAQKNVNNLGALAALGGMTHGSAGHAGLKLDSALKGTGSGSSAGKNTLGRINTGFVGNGLLSSGSGGNTLSKGPSGYGTKGRSGGRVGYGKQNMGGSSEGFELPMQGGGAVAGGLEMSQIEAVIRQNIGQIFYCYEKGLQAKPELDGRVVTKFQINGSGHVKFANIGQSNLKSSSVESCMISKIKGWKFPKPYGNVDVNVSYPFTLKRARHS